MDFEGAEFGDLVGGSGLPTTLGPGLMVGVTGRHYEIRDLLGPHGDSHHMVGGRAPGLTETLSRKVSAPHPDRHECLIRETER